MTFGKMYILQISKLITLTSKIGRPESPFRGGVPTKRGVCALKSTVLDNPHSEREFARIHVSAVSGDEHLCSLTSPGSTGSAGHWEEQEQVPFILVYLVVALVSGQPLLS